MCSPVNQTAITEPLRWDPVKQTLAELSDSALDTLHQIIARQSLLTFIVKTGSEQRSICFKVESTAPQPFSLKDYLESDRAICKALNDQVNLYQLNHKLMQLSPSPASVDSATFFRFSSSGDSESDADSDALKLKQVLHPDSFKKLMQTNIEDTGQRIEQKHWENKQRFHGCQIKIAGQTKKLTAEGKPGLLFADFELTAGTHQLSFISSVGDVISAVSPRPIKLNGIVELRMTGDLSHKGNQFHLEEAGQFRFLITTDSERYNLALTKV